MLIDNEIGLWGTDMDGEMAKMKNFQDSVFILTPSFLEWNVVTWQYDNN